ncbi:MAG TPA: shikimate dehydrogenase [Fimbriimonadaceae bacterium]|nr:shikimate dehydrogenase [Fimbriimonadaceae bacterium]HRJ95797.1 shikimate dehydrogenase [Fimbriimonadaceae bacterium]
MNGWTDWRETPPAEFAVIGDPVAHSLSPRMHRAAIRSLGWTYHYRAIRVPESEFGLAIDWLTRLGFRGLNVTLPLKEQAFRWADTLDEPTHRLGVANTLCLLTGRGTNTDAPGFMDVLLGAGLGPGSSILLLGAGGTARALAKVLVEAGHQVSIWNRTASKALVLAASVGAVTVREATAAGFAAIVNATAAGLAGESPPIDWSGSSKGTVVIDAGYADEPTPFVREARQRGLMAIDGRPLLLAQGVRSFEWWHGIEAPRLAMSSAIGLMPCAG